MITIPIDTTQSSHFTLAVNISDVVCNFRFLWNERDSSWYCDFSSSNGQNLGIKVVRDNGLLGSRSNIGADGDFRVLKANKTAEDKITYENFGNDYILVWGTSSEWEEFDDLRQGV